MDTSSAPTAAPSGSSIALGGDPVTVTYRRAFADKQPGDTESVLVRELEIDPGLIEFLKRVDDEPALAEFITARPVGFARALTRESVLAIVEKAMELNFSVAERWARMRRRMHEQLEQSGLAKKTTPSTGSALGRA